MPLYEHHPHFNTYLISEIDVQVVCFSSSIYHNFFSVFFPYVSCDDDNDDSLSIYKTTRWLHIDLIPHQFLPFSSQFPSHINIIIIIIVYMVVVVVIFIVKCLRMSYICVCGGEMGLKIGISSFRVGNKGRKRRRSRKKQYHLFIIDNNCDGCVTEVLHICLRYTSWCESMSLLNWWCMKRVRGLQSFFFFYFFLFVLFLKMISLRFFFSLLLSVMCCTL